MQEYTIYPLVVGANETDQGVMTYLHYYGQKIWIPIYVFYLKGGDKNILVDTGLDQFIVPEDLGKTYGFRIMTFEDALESIELKPDDIDVIIHTHLHNDHCENDYKCPRAQVYVQKAEMDFLREPHPVDHRFFPDILDGVDVIEVEGDTHLFDGIDLIFSPGHTVGTQSIAVNTSNGKAVIAGFCCNDKNFPETGPAITPGVHINVVEAYESVQKVKAMADILIPLHDISIGKMKTIP